MQRLFCGNLFSYYSLNNDEKLKTKELTKRFLMIKNNNFSESYKKEKPQQKVEVFKYFNFSKD